MTAAAIEPKRAAVITALGLTQILAWGSSYYLLAVLAEPIVTDTGWQLPWVVAGLSAGLLTAALASPAVGRQIGAHGGRPVLMLSSLLLAAGLIGLSLSTNLPIYFLSWAVIGLGMGAGLYDPAFATLGRLYGASARQAIAALTLFGGFASTACWPLSALLVTEFGWRTTCLAYALLHVAVALPLHALALPRGERGIVEVEDEGAVRERPAAQEDPGFSRLLFGLLAASVALSAAISTALSVHLLTVLTARGIGFAEAVALGALVGPAQVGARAMEFGVARYHHPVWTLVASAALVALGVGMLWLDWPFLSLALVLYGAGIGLESIARGTTPLALFPTDRFAELMGRLAFWSLLAQAMAPIAAAWILDWKGADVVMAALVALALCKLGLAFGVRAHALRHER